MTLSDTGESRVRGYLYVLERSLRSSVSSALAADAIREVDSHIRERVAESSGMPNERDALEAILTRLGSPGTVAKAYSLEMIMDEAAVGGRVLSVMQSLFLAAGTGVGRFFIALLLFDGYLIGAGFVSVAVLKPIFPNHVGLWVHDGISLGVQFPQPGVQPLGGYWIIPICVLVGFGILLFTHAMARRWVANLRDRGWRTSMSRV